MNAFQISSCVTRAQEQDESRQRSASVYADITALLVTLVESCKQEIYHRGTFLLSVS